MERAVQESVVEELVRGRAKYRFPLNIRAIARRLADDTLAILFPHFADTHRCDPAEVHVEVERLADSLTGLTHSLAELYPVPDSARADRFLARLPEVAEVLLGDARAIHHGDPASTSVDEVILCYPGFYAIGVHRIAHVLHELGFPLAPRLVSEYAHQRTGIDIHPAARIGHAFFIDHGTGVVIGETAEIGAGVKLYQGVTLGALAVDRDLKSRKRHPTVGDNVVIYANATILGGGTVIGHDSVIGGNAWVTKSVPPFSVVGRHADIRRIRESGRDDALEFHI